MFVIQTDPEKSKNNKDVCIAYTYIKISGSGHYVENEVKRIT